MVLSRIESTQVRTRFCSLDDVAVDAVRVLLRASRSGLMVRVGTAPSVSICVARTICRRACYHRGRSHWHMSVPINARSLRTLRRAKRRTQRHQHQVLRTATAARTPLTNQWSLPQTRPRRSRRELGRRPRAASRNPCRARPQSRPWRRGELRRTRARR